MNKSTLIKKIRRLAHERNVECIADVTVKAIPMLQGMINQLETLPDEKLDKDYFQIKNTSHR